MHEVKGPKIRPVREDKKCYVGRNVIIQEKGKLDV